MPSGWRPSWYVPATSIAYTSFWRFAHICAILENVTGSEFLRKLQRLARRRAVRFQYEPSLGKGSHGRVWLDTVSTTLKYPKKELGTGLLRAMCRDLRIEPRDL